MIGQILDYTAEIAKWDYEQLSDAISKATGGSATSMYEVALEGFPGLDEATFVGDVERSLQEGRFLLAIAGDGIRENVERIVSLIQASAAPQFSFALIEVGVYRLQSDGINGVFVQPSVHARTLDIERFAYSRIDVLDGKKQGEKPVFEEICAEFPDLPEFLKRLEYLGIRPSVKKTIVLRYSDPVLGNLNFGTIHRDGSLNFNYICDSAEACGDLSIGEEYLQSIAELMPESVVVKRGYSWTWTVRADQEGTWLSVDNALEYSDDWFNLIKNALNRFKELKRIIEEQDESE